MTLVVLRIMMLGRIDFSGNLTTHTPEHQKIPANEENETKEDNQARPMLGMPKAVRRGRAQNTLEGVQAGLQGLF